MKKLISTIVLFIITINLWSQVSITKSNVNFRNSPNQTGEIISVIPKNTEITIIENIDDWSKISYNGQEGYISSKFIKTTSNKDLNKNIQSKNNSTNQNVKYYTNSKGERVQSPTYYDSPPPGATALCRDGTYSFSKNRRGTCSHHGGVQKWL